MTRGLWNMPCWNGLSEVQQRRLVEYGNLPINYVAAGWCQRPAAVGVETEMDEAPAPRFYCWDCALTWIDHQRTEQLARDRR